MHHYHMQIHSGNLILIFFETNFCIGIDIQKNGGKNYNFMFKFMLILRAKRILFVRLIELFNVPFCFQFPAIIFFDIILFLLIIFSTSRNIWEDSCSIRILTSC